MPVPKDTSFVGMPVSVKEDFDRLAKLEAEKLNMTRLTLREYFTRLAAREKKTNKL